MTTTDPTTRAIRAAALARDLADELAAIAADAWRAGRPPAAIYTIPGTFYVTVGAAPYTGDPTVTRLAFTPAAGDAGYHGPAAEWWSSAPDPARGIEPGADNLADGPDDADQADAYWHPDEDPDASPLWLALRDALTPVTRFWSLDDNDDDRTVDGPAVPIEWTE